MTRMSVARRLAAVIALSLVGGVALVASPASPAAAGPCPGGKYYSITSHSSYHLAHTKFKDGPGPAKVTVSVTKSGSVSFTGKVTGGASVGGIIAQAKIEVSAALTKSKKITVGHKVTKKIKKGKYLHSNYGSWGKKVKWKYGHENTKCKRTVKSKGTAKIPQKKVGWRFFHTKS